MIFKMIQDSFRNFLSGFSPYISSLQFIVIVTKAVRDIECK